MTVGEKISGCPSSLYCFGRESESVVVYPDLYVYHELPTRREREERTKTVRGRMVERVRHIQRIPMTLFNGD